MVSARGEQRRTYLADADENDLSMDKDCGFSSGKGDDTEEDEKLTAMAKRQEETDIQKKRNHPDAMPKKRAAPKSNVPRRRFMAAAAAAPDISEIPATSAAISMRHLDPKDPDAKILPPDKLCAQCGLSAYSWFLYYPGHPPHPKYVSWSEYEAWVATLVYRSLDWGKEHDKFMTASFAAIALGVSTRETVAAGHFKMRFPSALKESNPFRIRIFESGVQQEVLHREFYQLTMGDDVVLISDCGSEVHKTEKWMMMTPDGKVYLKDPSAPNGLGEHIRNTEYKTPVRREAYLAVPDEYMPQLQMSMEVDDVDQDDFCSMRVDGDTGYCRWIAIRVYRSEEYWNKALPVLREFTRAVLTGATPPPKGTFDPKSIFVKTEMLVRLEDALDLIPNGRAKLNDVLETTETNAQKTHKENLEYNQQVRMAQMTADIQARKDTDKKFEEEK